MKIFLIIIAFIFCEALLIFAFLLGMYVGIKGMVKKFNIEDLEED